MKRIKKSIDAFYEKKGNDKLVSNMANMEKINKTTCDVKETNETFDFIIEK